MWTLFLPISQKQYGRHPTHFSWSCHIYNNIRATSCRTDLSESVGTFLLGFWSSSTKLNVKTMMGNKSFYTYWNTWAFLPSSLVTDHNVLPPSHPHQPSPRQMQSNHHIQSLHAACTEESSPQEDWWFQPRQHWNCCGGLGRRKVKSENKINTYYFHFLFKRGVLFGQSSILS